MYSLICSTISISYLTAHRKFIEAQEEVNDDLASLFCVSYHLASICTSTTIIPWTVYSLLVLSCSFCFSSSLSFSWSLFVQEIQRRELQRVKKVASSLQEFAKLVFHNIIKLISFHSLSFPLVSLSHLLCHRTLSNTAPVYLESMQRIVMSVDNIDGSSDIESFVNEYPHLHQLPPLPELELHKCSVSVWRIACQLLLSFLWIL